MFACADYAASARGVLLRQNYSLRRSARPSSVPTSAACDGEGGGGSSMALPASLQAALERLDPFPDRRPDFRDALGAEHQRHDGDQNENMPNAEVGEHAQNVAASAQAAAAPPSHLATASSRTVGRSNPATTTVATNGPAGA